MKGRGRGGPVTFDLSSIVCLDPRRANFCIHLFGELVASITRLPKLCEERLLLEGLTAGGTGPTVVGGDGVLEDVSTLRWGGMNSSCVRR